MVASTREEFKGTVLRNHRDDVVRLEDCTRAVSAPQLARSFSRVGDEPYRSLECAGGPLRRFGMVLAPWLCRPMPPTCGSSQFDPVVPRMNQILLGAQVPFSGLDRCMAQQKLNLLESASRRAAHFGEAAPQGMGCNSGHT
jgi:hypothetical protein